MKQIDFENGKITDNILRSALPMLAAQILSLLYNIVDRIYIARIPGIGTAALGAVGNALLQGGPFLGLLFGSLLQFLAFLAAGF